jgi:hypothetical protein
MCRINSPRSKPGTVAEIPAKDGAPWRPFEDTGILVRTTPVPRQASTVFRECGRQLLTHLRADRLYARKP